MDVGVELEHPVRDGGGGGVRDLLDDAAVGEEHDAVGVSGGQGVVGDHDDGLAEVVAGVAEEPQQRLSVPGVEVAGRLVGEHDLRSSDQCAGDGDPLLLSPGELGRAVAQPLAEPEGVDELVQPVRVRAASGQVQREGDVLLCGEGGKQVEALEHEPEPVAAQQRALPLTEGGEVGVADEHAGRRRGRRARRGRA